MKSNIATEAFLNKMAGIADWDTADLHKGYRNITGSPLGAAALNAALIGIPSYFLAAPIARTVTTLKGKALGYSPEEMQRAMAETERSIPKHKWQVAAILAALAGGATLASTYVPESVNPKGGGMRSWLNWDLPEQDNGTMRSYEMAEGIGKSGMDKSAFVDVGVDPHEWKKPIETLEDVPWVDNFDFDFEGNADKEYFKSKGYTVEGQDRSGDYILKDAKGNISIFYLGDNTIYPLKKESLNILQGINKSASMFNPAYKNALFDHPGVPIKSSLDLIWEDKYLSNDEKINATMPFKEADNGQSGVLSTGDLVQGAVRAGFGLGGGYIAGKTLGTIFGAPADVTQALSVTGALAGMLKNTGVF